MLDFKTYSRPARWAAYAVIALAFVPAAVIFVVDLFGEESSTGALIFAPAIAVAALGIAIINVVDQLIRLVRARR